MTRPAQDAVLEFLRRREDAALYGAQAVNAYAREKRMSEDVDVVSPSAKELAEELRAHLAERFRIAMRVRLGARGKGYRLYRLRKPENRDLVDVRAVAALPPARGVEEVLVVEPEELPANRVMAYVSRQGTPRSWTDRRDIAALLPAFPALKSAKGPVRGRLEAAGAPPGALAAWESLVAEEIREAPEDAEFS